jgi:hypothetical protein
MTTIHYSAIQFFESRMSEHSAVRQYVRLPIANECVYKITRSTLPDLNVMLSDAYRFGIADYVGRPRCIGRGDFILVPPHCNDYYSAIDRATKEGVGIGKIREFMGALNFRLPSDYFSRKRT